MVGVVRKDFLVFEIERAPQSHGAKGGLLCRSRRLARTTVVREWQFFGSMPLLLALLPSA